VIAGVITPKTGQAVTHGIIAPLIELGAGFDPELTGIENIWMACSLMGVPKRTIAEKLDEIIAFAELGDFIYAPIKTYSSGMYMRLGFACSTIIDPDILLVDEILAVGDSRFQRKCLNLINDIQSRQKTIVLVSHDKSTVQSICTRTVFIWKGQVIYDGDTDTAFTIYETLMANQHLENSPFDVAAEVLRKNEMYRKVDEAGFARHVARIDQVTAQMASKEEDRTQLLQLKVVIKANYANEKPLTVGFQLRDRHGHRVFGNNTKDDLFIEKSQTLLLTKEGESTIEWTLDCSHLASGRYAIDVSLSNYEITEIYEFIADATCITLINIADPLNHDHNIMELNRVRIKIT
jgi:ABC-type polysaccharide/polyol phosphate transport system ATPase subunit